MRYLYTLLAVTFLVACSDEIVREQAKDIPSVFPDGTVGDTVSDPSDASGPEDTVANVETYALKFEEAVGDDNVSCANSVNCAIYAQIAVRTLNVVLTGDGKPQAVASLTRSGERPRWFGPLNAYTAYTNGSGVAGIEGKPISTGWIHSEGFGR